MIAETGSQVSWPLGRCLCHYLIFICWGDSEEASKALGWNPYLVIDDLGQVI